MLNLAAALVFVIGLLLTSTLVGRFILTRILGKDQGALWPVLAPGLGLLFFSHLILLAVQAQWTGPIFVKILAGLLALPGWLFFVFRERFRSHLFSDLSPLPRFFFLGYACLLLPFWALPPLAIDEFVYHLEVPKRILQEGGQVLFVDNICAYFPQFLEMLFLPAQAVAGSTGAVAVHAAFGLLTALSAYLLLLSYGAKAAGGKALFLVLTVPSIFVLSAQAYVDLAFTFYCFLALIAVTRFLEQSGERWLVLAGIFAGASWSIKYTGLQVTLLLFLLLLLFRLIYKRPDLNLAFFLWPALSLLMVSPYLLRNWYWTGWPLYPFQMGLFSLEPAMNWGPDRSRLLLSWLIGLGGFEGRGLWEQLLSPLLVFLTARFGDLSSYDGMVGPALLVGFFWVFRAKRESFRRPFLMFALLFFGYWMVTTPQVRFLLPVIPVLAVLVGWSLEKSAPRWSTWLVMLLALSGLALGVRHELQQRPWSYWSGSESRQDFWRSRVIGFPVYEEVNERLEGDERVYLLNMRNLGYLLEVDWRADFIFEYYRVAQILAGPDPVATLRSFFEEQQITHLMIDESVTLSGQALPEAEREWLREFLRRYGERMYENPRRSGQRLYLLHR